MSEMTSAKKILIVMFFLCISLPVLNTLSIKLDTEPLAGVADSYPLPQLTWSDWYNGSFQGQFENSFSKGFSGVRTATRLYNELRYKAFNLGDEKTIICTDGSIIYKQYVDEYLGLDYLHYCSPDYIKNLSAQLKRLTDLSREQGKELAVVITPSKADYWHDRIPKKYYQMERYYDENQRGARLLTAAMERDNVTFVDGASILQSTNHPYDVFTETGIHYTREAALDVLDALNSALQNHGITMKRIVSDGRNYSTEPVRNSLNQDDDIWLLMNMFSKRETIYSYPIEKEITPESYDMPIVFCQGGSFIWPLYEALIEHEAVKDINVLFYAEGLYDRYRSYYPAEHLDDPVIEKAVEESNLILLEVNEENVYNMGSGFLDYLERVLADDMPRAVMETVNAEEFRISYHNLGPEETANGVTWRCSRGTSAEVVFSNTKAEDTLFGTYWIPYSVYASQHTDILPEIQIEVYVNGELYQEQPCSEDSIFEVSIPAHLFQTGEAISVVIQSPYTLLEDSANGYRSFQVLNAGRE